MINISQATRSDVGLLAGLLEEMDRFYGATEFLPLERRTALIHRQLFVMSPPAATVLIAWSNAVAVGFASYSFLWPAVGETRSLYLKELYVQEDQRGTGIGTALIRALAEVAAEHHCSRIEWTTDHTNAQAQKFYDRINVPRNNDKIFYRLDEDGIHRLAGK